MHTFLSRSNCHAIVCSFSNQTLRYTKALVYREALKSMEIVPNEEALTKAAQMTRVLFAAGHIYCPFDARFDAKEPDEMGCLPDFKAGTVCLAVVDSSPSPVPFFPKLLVRQSTPKECITCSKKIFEVAYSNIDRWKWACAHLCGDITGPWMWKVLAFPTRETQKCDHVFDVCRTCTAEHIRNTLESRGSTACDRLTCPQCNRKLEYEETIELADSETVAKYVLLPLQGR